MIQRMQRLGWLPATVKGWAQVYAGAAALAGWTFMAIGFKSTAPLVLAATVTLFGVDFKNYATLYGKLIWRNRNTWVVIGLACLYLIAAPVPAYLVQAWRRERAARKLEQVTRVRRIAGLERDLRV